MRVLLDTNVLIHREASFVVRQEIGKVFFWLDKLKHDKCVHPVSLAEIAEHRDEKVRAAFHAKLQSYQILKNDCAPCRPGSEMLYDDGLSGTDLTTPGLESETVRFAG
jgi:hypothetical protein